MVQQTDTKQIKIATGSVNRLRKELNLYQKEYEANLKKVVELHDDYAAKKQQELADESKLMISDTEKRLVKATNVLQSLVEVAGDCEEKQLALKALEV